MQKKKKNPVDKLKTVPFMLFSEEFSEQIQQALKLVLEKTSGKQMLKITQVSALTEPQHNLILIRAGFLEHTCVQ